MIDESERRTMNDKRRTSNQTANANRPQQQQANIGWTR